MPGKPHALVAYGCGECLSVGWPYLTEWNSVLRTLGTCKCGFNCAKIHFHDLGKFGVRRIVGAKQALCLGVTFGKFDLPGAASGKAHVLECLVVDGKETHR